VRRATKGSNLSLISGLRSMNSSPEEGFTRPMASIPYQAGRTAGVFALALALSVQALPISANPQPLPKAIERSTLDAFDRYVKLTDARNDSELRSGTGLLWIDGLPPAERAKEDQELKRGAVQMRKLETLDGGKAIRCPDGMIHHWVGLVFIPGAKLPDVLGILQDYDRQATYYAPDVERSRIESRTGDHFRVLLRFRRHQVITVVLDTEHDVQYFRDSATRAHSRSSAVRIAEVENAGKSDEREKPPGDDNGFLWKMETWWLMMECEDGVYVQSEVVSLTRDIPPGLAWMIGPFVTSIPKQSLAFTLEATRRAVHK
jgi:hypothetical protein